MKLLQQLHRNLLTGAVLLMLPVLTATARDVSVILPDTTVINYDEIDEETLLNDTTGKTHRNLATGFNALDYILDKRYRSYGDDFTRRWDDHLFVQSGVGAEVMTPPTSDYKFDPLTTFSLSVGKQFNKLLSARLALGMGIGYQHQKDVVFYKYTGKLDFLFSLSSYFGGYNPARLLESSVVLGVGGQYSDQPKYHIKGFSPEGHLGLQFKFFTGPQAYLALEPYVGIASDKMDLSDKRNWKGYDTFYGANLSFIYYLHNNLSPQARERFVRNRIEANYLTADSVLQSWRMPWFVEFAIGPNMTSSIGYSLTNTMGYEQSISVGKWLSPVLGLRLSAFSRSSTWYKDVIPEVASPYSPEYERQYHTLFWGGRLEGMLNPFGLTNNYVWNRTFGAYVIFGGEFGRLAKYQPDEYLRCNCIGYNAGIHLWARLSSDLQLFIEPRYTYNVYEVPYTNVNWNKRFAEDSYTLKVGVTMMNREKRYRVDYDSADETLKRFVIGATGGVNLIQTSSPVYSGENTFNYNAGGYLVYRLNHLHGFKLSFEYLSRSVNSISQYHDAFIDTDETQVVVEKEGLWGHNYHLGIGAVAYEVNLATLMAGYVPNRTFDLFFSVGPTVGMIFGEKAKLDSKERLQEGHTPYIAKNVKNSTHFGAMASFSLAGNVTRHFSIVLSPTLYMLSGMKFDGLTTSGTKDWLPMVTVNMGVQYRF